MQMYDRPLPEGGGRFFEVNIDTQISLFFRDLIDNMQKKDIIKVIMHRR